MEGVQQHLEDLTLPILKLKVQRCSQNASYIFFKQQAALSYLWLNVQNSNFVLLVNLVHSLKFGAEHVALVTPKLQELIGRDVFCHLLRGDKVVVFPIHLVLLLRAGGVCRRRGTERHGSWAAARR